MGLTSAAGLLAAAPPAGAGALEEKVVSNSLKSSFSLVSSIFSQMVPFTCSYLMLVQGTDFMGTDGLCFAFPTGAAGAPNPGGGGIPGGLGAPGGGGGPGGAPGGLGAPGGGGGGGGPPIPGGGGGGGGPPIPGGGGGGGGAPIPGGGGGGGGALKPGGGGGGGGAAPPGNGGGGGGGGPAGAGGPLGLDLICLSSSCNLASSILYDGHTL